MNGSSGSPTPERPEWRTVAVPTEHGGWGLTFEPIVLGLMISPSPAGGMLAVGAVAAFLARTPLKLLLVDSRRGRDLTRTDLARRVLCWEAGLLTLCGLSAAVLGDPRLWLPLLVAGPLVALELWFDMRSKSRRLVPELAGAVGVSAVVGMIVLADGEPMALAAAVWLILAARAFASIPFVRDQVNRLHGRPESPGTVAAGEAAALVAAVTAMSIQEGTIPGGTTIALIIVVQRSMSRKVPSSAVVLGVRQTITGATLVMVTALGILAP